MFLDNFSGDIRRYLLMPMIKILVACCSSLSRRGLSELLSDEKDFLIVRESATIDDIVCWTEKKNPDIILLCSHLLKEYGSDVVVSIRKINQEAKIIVFESAFNINQQILLIRRGVVGILESDCAQQTFIKALRTVYAGEYWFRRNLIPSLISSASPLNAAKKTSNGKFKLTTRELEVLSCIAAGYKNCDISSKLYVSASTVKTHINSIFSKLEVTDRLQATFYAVNHDILPK